MDFVRYCGELVVHYALIATGGRVLTGLMLLIFSSIGIDGERFAVEWLIPDGRSRACGIWLVAQREGMIENVAPVLAGVFTPLFATARLAFLGAMAWTDRPIEVEREVLIAFDLLLGVVVGLLLDNTSARDLRAPPGSVRSTPTRPVRGYRSRSARSRHASPDSASPPNRVTALGEDFLLLVHLAWSTHLPARFLRSGTGFAAAGRWKISYLPVYSGWAAPRGRWLPADPRIRPTTDRMGGLTGRANSTRAGRRQPAPGTNPPSTDPSWAAPTPGRGAEGDATSGCARRRRDHPASRSSFPPRTSGRDS